MHPPCSQRYIKHNEIPLLNSSSNNKEGNDAKKPPTTYHMQHCDDVGSKRQPSQLI